MKGKVQNQLECLQLLPSNGNLKFGVCFNFCHNACKSKYDCIICTELLNAGISFWKSFKSAVGEYAGNNIKILTYLSWPKASFGLNSSKITKFTKNQIFWCFYTLNFIRTKFQNFQIIENLCGKLIPTIDCNISRNHINQKNSFSGGQLNQCQLAARCLNRFPFGIKCHQILTR